MENIELILVTDFCKYHEISYSFVSGLSEAGIIEVVTEERGELLRTDQLAQLEKLVRFHKDLDINPAGVEAIAHLLERMNDMQRQMQQMQQLLNLYDRDISTGH
jgi:chaperone modulatory protein CbpM